MKPMIMLKPFLALLLFVGANSIMSTQVISHVQNVGQMGAEHMAMLNTGSNVIIAFNPVGHSDIRFLCSSDGGATFKPTGGTPVDGFGGASVALYKGKVFIAFHGGDRDRHVNVAEVVLDAAGCPKDVNLITKLESSHSTDAPPVLLSTDKQLLVGWMNRPDASVYLGVVNIP